MKVKKTIEFERNVRMKDLADEIFLEPFYNSRICRSEHAFAACYTGKCSNFSKNV